MKVNWAIKGRNFTRQIGGAVSEYLPVVGLVATIMITSFANFGDTMRDTGSMASQELAGQSVISSRGGSGGRGGSESGGSGGGWGGNTGGGGQSGDSSGGSQNGSGGTSSSGGGTGSSGGSGSTGGNNASGPPGGNGSGSGGGSGGGGSGGAADDDQDIDDESDTDEPGAVVDTNTDPDATEEEEPERDIVEFITEFAAGVWEGIQTQFWDLVEFLGNPIQTARDLYDLGVGLFADFDGTMAALKDALKNELDRITSGDPRQLGQVIGENLSPGPLANAVSKVRGLSKFAAAAKKADSGCSSFVAGTLVWTAAGFSSIEDISIEDLVHTRNDVDFTDHTNSVTALISREAPGYYEIEAGNELVRVTSEHPFWRQGDGWTEAKDLQPGDPIAAATGDVVVVSTRYVKGPVSVYNFSVERNHNYFVSPSKLWVHNQAKPCNLEERAKFVKEKIDAMLTRLPEQKRQKLGELLDSNPNLKNAFVENPDLVEAWDLFDDAGMDELAGDLPKLEKLSENLVENRSLKDALQNNPKLIKGWDVLDDAGYASKKADPASLEKVVTLLDNPKLAQSGLNEDTVKDLIAGNRKAGAGSAALDDLTDGLNNLVNNGTRLDNTSRLISDLNKGGNFAEGAGFILRDVTGSGSKFANKTVVFEETIATDTGIRRVDVVVREAGKKDIFYEYKSVSSVPPAGFKDQFAKDLANGNVTSVDQIRWKFDGKKVSDLPRDDFLDSIESIDIAPDTLRKLGFNNKGELLTYIDSNFDNIFSIE